MTEKKATKKKTNRPCGHSTKSKRAGRPRLELDENQVYKLAEAGMTDREIASLLDVSTDTLQRFRCIIQKGRSQLSQSIKRAQLDLALGKSDRTMLIWTGKQYAGQSEKTSIEHSGDAMSTHVTVYSDKAKKWGTDDV